MNNEDGADIGPFWSEKKRYPSVQAFNPEDETHTNFMLSATCMFGVMLGLIPPKDEHDSEWLSPYRERDWIINVTSDLVPPAYIQVSIRYVMDLKEAIPLGGWDMLGYWVVQYNTLVSLYHPSYFQYQPIPYTH